MTIIETIHDPALFRPLFKSLDTWRTWLMILKAIFALEMTDDERTTFTTLSGRQTPPAAPVNEAWIIAGRRSGKSRIVALIAAYLACFRDYRPFLAPGERGVIAIVAVDRKQARVIMRYLTAILNSVPMLAAMMHRQDAESIDLNNGISLEILTGSYRTIRGRTVVAFIGEETPYWRDEESANPAEETLAAVRPAMATIPNALLICVGSPYRRFGVAYEVWSRHFGREGSPILVFQASSQQMNPTIPQHVIDEAMERDPVAALAEWFAQFRSDVGSYIDRGLAELANEPGCRERAPLPGVQYCRFMDVAEGMSATGDWMGAAIAHLAPRPIPRSWQEEQKQREQPPRVVLDAVRWVKPPFNPEQVLAEFALWFKRYPGGNEVVADRVSQGWVGPALARHGLRFKPSELTKSEIYLRALPLFTSGSIDLLDVPQLMTQLLQLERTTHRSGRDHVDHPPFAGARDDVVNAALGAVTLCTQRQARVWTQKLIGI